MKHKQIIPLLLLLTCSSGIAQTIYVSTSGNDNNPGTEGQPLASINGANGKIKELRQNEVLNDTIFVKISSGTYYIMEPIEFNSENSGKENSPVAFVGDGEDRPVICGGIVLTPFEVVSPGLWRTKIQQIMESGLYFEQLYINGERRFRAQTPNRGENKGKLYRIKSASESISGQHQIFVRDEDKAWLSEISDEDINDVLVGFYHNWDYSPKRILQPNPSDASFRITDEGVWSWNPLTTESRYIVENYSGALDAPGEWYLNRDGYLYYIPLSGETPGNVTAIAPVTEQFMSITGGEVEPVAHISFRNLRFEVAAHNTPANGEVLGQASSAIDASIMIDYADNINFINCDVAHTGLHAIWYRWKCSQSKVEHCHLYDLGGGGIKIGTDHYDSDYVTNSITIHNNIIQHGGYVFPSAAGVIVFQASDNVISHNDIADFCYSGISVGWTWGYGNSAAKRNTIKYNHIHHLGWGELSDMGGIYTLGVSEGTVVNNNVIHHIYSYSYGGWGLYTDEGSSHILMKNNLVYKCKSAGFDQHYGKNNIIRNNIFALNHISQLQPQLRLEDGDNTLSLTNNIVYSDEGSLYINQGDKTWKDVPMHIDYNCYWHTQTDNPDFHGLTFDEWKNLRRDGNSVLANPMFRDPENYDFNFRDLSSVNSINFTPFDYSAAGVYGSANWLRKAELPTKLKEDFEKVLPFTSPYKVTLSIDGDISCIKSTLLPGVYRVEEDHNETFKVTLYNGHPTTGIRITINGQEIKPSEINLLSSATEYTYHTGVITSYIDIVITGVIEIKTPENLIWTGLGCNNDWHDPANWQAPENEDYEIRIPAKNTNVLIPAGMAHYPDLTPRKTDYQAKASAECKIIRFEQGAEIGRQDLLNYEKAFVEYDFGTSGRSDCYRMLSVPLKEAYPGDFTFGRQPKVYLQTFEIDEADGKGKWVTAVGGNTGKFTAGAGFVLSIEPDNSSDKGLGLSGGILRLPFYDIDSNVDSDVHPNHVYSEGTGESVIIGESTFTDPNGDDYYDVSRTEDGHRLAGAIVDITPYFGKPGNSHFALVGNPFMKTIDFDKLQSENDDLIKNSYHVWTKVGEEVGYISYHPENAFGIIGSSLDSMLAPLQGFIVERIETGVGTLRFDLTKVACGDKASLRSEQVANNKLEIIAKNDKASVLTFIAKRDGGSEQFGNSDSRKLINKLSAVPDIYTLKLSENGPVAVGANITNIEDAEYPLGLATTFEGDITFTFSGMDSYDAKIFFVDKQSDKTIELTNMSGYEYTFSYTPPRTGAEITGTDDRFYIRIRSDETSNETIGKQLLYAYAKEGAIHVVSVGAVMQEIKIYSLQGVELYQSKINDTSHIVSKKFLPSVYIVTVKTDNGIISKKIIVNQ